MGGSNTGMTPQWNDEPSAETWLGEGPLPDQGHGGEQNKALKTPKMTAPVAAWRGNTPRVVNVEVTNQYASFEGNKGTREIEEHEETREERGHRLPQRGKEGRATTKRGQSHLTMKHRWQWYRLLRSNNPCYR